MPDDKRKTHPHDAKRIDINDPSEVRSWCKAFDCTEPQLKAAVKAVGTSAAAVKKYLQCAHRESNTGRRDKKNSDSLC